MPSDQIAFRRVVGLAAGLALLAAPAIAQPRHHFSLGGKGERHEAGGAAAEFDLTADITEGRLSLLDEVWSPDFLAPPHFHKRHTEIFYVVEGQVEWTVAGERRVMGPGDVVYIPPNTVHSVRVLGGKPLRMIMISEPGGYEDNMRRMAEAAARGPLDAAAQARLNAENDFHPSPGR